MASVAHLTLDRLRAAAREVAEAHGLDLVVLFGSAAREGLAEARDVDLGIRGEGARAADWGMPAAYVPLLRRLDTDAVDVVDLGSASPLLLAHVARDGVPLFEATPGAFAAFRADAERRFEDALPQYDAEWEETKRAIRALLPPEPDYRPWGDAG